jgi:hypothetical protein
MSAKNSKMTAVTIYLEEPVIKELELLAYRDGKSLEEYIKRWVITIPEQEMTFDEETKYRAKIARCHQERDTA